VDRFVRERLFGAMAAYMQQGTAAFKPLEDKSTGVSIDEQLKVLLANTSNLIAYYPELATRLHLDRVRADSLGGAFGGIERGEMAGAMKGALDDFLKKARENLQSRVK
jgi:hypothetical protein